MSQSQSGRVIDILETTSFESEAFCGSFCFTLMKLAEGKRGKSVIVSLCAEELQKNCFNIDWSTNYVFDFDKTHCKLDRNEEEEKLSAHTIWLRKIFCCFGQILIKYPTQRL